MKTFILLFSILFATLIMDAQKKILFDNTKNEQAGNADWVIDDGVNRYPSPAQTGITGNGLPSPTGTAENFWSGSLSSWGVEMAKKGYTVETLPPTGKITYGDATNAQDLSNYNVFVIDEPNNLFSTTEKAALINFVQNGGGLFMVSDHNVADRDNDGYDAVAVWNNFFSYYNNPFGITYDLTNISQTSTNVISSTTDPILHGVAGDVGAIKLSNGATITINTSSNSSVKGIIYKTGVSNTGTTGILAAYATYGSGRVFAITDSSIPEDITPNSGTTYNGWGEPTTSPYQGHHGRLVTNATIWLANGSGSTTTPTISASPSSLTGFTYVLANGPSTNKSFTISGSNLSGSGNITITGSTDYQVSTDGTTFSSSVTYAYASGVITGQPKTVYVRLKSGLAVGNYNSENISISGGSASTINVSCSGSVTSSTPSSSCGTETFSKITTGSASYTTQTWTGDNGGTWTATSARTDQTINGAAICFKGYLQSPSSASGIGDLTVTTKYPFSDGTSTLTVTVNGTTVGTLPISTTAQTTTISGINISGNVQIQISSDGTKRAAIDDMTWTCYSGAATPSVTVNTTTLTSFGSICTGSTSSESSIIVSGSALTANLVVTAPSGFEVSKTSGSGFASSVSFTPTSGAVASSTVYVHFIPTAAQSYSGNISVTSTSATTQSVSVSGTGVCTSATISTPSSASVTSSSAVLGGNISSIGCSNATERGIYYSTTSGFANGSGTKVSVTGSFTTGTFTVSVSGLSSGTTYYFKAFATNGCGTVYTTQSSFTTSATASAPIATTVAASSITTSGATLNGSVNNNNAASTTVTFEYGTTTSYGSTATATPSSVTGSTNTSVTASITGLAANTTYHFRVKAVNSVGTTYGSDLTFTTSSSVTAPTATTVAASSITTSGATLNGTVNNNGAASTTVTFEYGTTTSYGSTATATPSSVTGSTNTSVSAAITGLAANTTYHFRVKAVNSVGTTYGTDMTFTTNATTITYCASKGTSQSYEWLDYFALGTLTNTTSKNSGYGDFTSMTAPTLALGSSQTVYFSAAFTSTAYTEYFKVYIDYNHNGVFTDAGETVASGSSSSTGNLSATFTVPTSALTGTTRCRIVMSDNSATTSCGTYSYGETEDYTVNISATGAKSSILFAGQTEQLEPLTVEYIGLYPVPASTFVTIKVQSQNVSANATIYNLKGQVVKSQILNSNEQTIDISNLPSGSYMLIYNDRAKQYVKKFIKQ